MSQPILDRKKRRKRRTRNYRQEYQARKAKGLAAGKSLSASRGHPKAADLGSLARSVIDRTDPREHALKLMRDGFSQAQAAKAAGVSVERLRLYRLLNTTSVRQGKRWVISDQRPQSLWLATNGGMRAVTLPRDEASDVGRYWAAANKFLGSNDAAHLKPFAGKGVHDVEGRFWPYEVRPNILRKLDSVGELHFLEIYADVSK